MAFEKRDFQGFAQFREGKGRWRFYVAGFTGYAGEVGEARVMRHDGTYERVPVDAKNRITIHGKKYGQTHWDH